MAHPNLLVPLALAGYVLVAFGCLLLLGARRGVVAALLGGWLFLPCFTDGTFEVPLLHGKETFVPGVVLAASLLVDGARWQRLRLRLVDVPVLLLCLAPFGAAMANGLGVYDAVSALFEQLMEWGAPYLLGRVYLGAPRHVEELAAALVAAALVYAPLCLWEVRMSPQLHAALYGFSTFGFGQAMRFGGFRPSVFMSHGLMLGMFMATATLVAFWLWRTGARRAVLGLPLGPACAALLVTTILCKSTGAIGLLLVGGAVLEATRHVRTPALVLALLAIPPAYCAARLGGWTAKDLVVLAGRATNAERAQSLEFRLAMEDQLSVKALERPWLGWGRWGRSRIYDHGRDISVTDGLWIITLGVAGSIGLVALGLTLAAPAVALLRSVPVGRWSHPAVAPAAALTVATLLWAVDDLFNGMVTPLFPAMMGAIASFTALVRRPGRRKRVGRAHALPALVPAVARPHAS
jgi:hypothetical protein